MSGLKLGALMTRTGFCGIFYSIYTGEPQKVTSMSIQASIYYGFISFECTGVSNRGSSRLGVDFSLQCTQRGPYPLFDEGTLR